MLRAWFLALGLATLPVAPAATQTVVTDRPGCRGCTIRAVARAAFRTEAAAGGLAGVPLQVLHDGRGYWWVVVPGQRPLVFDARGAFVREVGRTGSGPGEFRGVSSVAALPGDSVLLVDAQLRRASVFAPDFRFVRSIPLPVRGGRTAVLDWPRRVVVNSVGNSAEQAGWPLHLLDLSREPGAHLRWFGDVRERRAGGNTPASLRHFFGVERGSFWTLHRVRYQLTRYDAAGNVRHTVQRQTPLFPGESSWSIGTPTSPPPAFLEAATVRGDTLWTVLRVPRPDWQRAWADARLPPGGEVPAGRGPEPSELHMTRVEAIDLERGVLLAHRLLNGIVVHLEPDLTAVLYDLDDDAVPRLRLISLALVRD